MTLVGCELLCGVHCVTSSSCAQYLQLARNDFSPQPCLSNFQLCEKINSNDFGNKTLSPGTNSSSIQNSFPPVNFPLPSSVQSLQKYILKGSAWRCLALLQALEVEVS